MSSECIFCKIVAGELPASRVYEDEHTLAFMDIGPVMKGHVLVIPKSHFDPITATPDETLASLISTVRKVAGAVMRRLEADGVTITQANGAAAGQVVPHVHFHVIPRFDTDTVPRGWKPGNYESTDEMNAYAEKIRAGL